MAAARNDHTAAPYAIAVDTREQLPYAFARPIKVATGNFRQLRTERKKLDAGDYSIVGHEHEVSIERKSLADLYGTLGKGRARFAREMDRLAPIAWSAVVVEAPLHSVLVDPPSRSRMSPLSVYRTILSWSVKYSPRWYFFQSRDVAEASTAWLLEFNWRRISETVAGRRILSITAPE